LAAIAQSVSPGRTTTRDTESLAGTFGPTWLEASAWPATPNQIRTATVATARPTSAPTTTRPRLVSLIGVRSPATGRPAPARTAPVIPPATRPATGSSAADG